MTKLKPTPERTIRWMKKARAKLDSGDRERGAGDHTEAGERLQNAAEIALKTLIMANGEQHEHTHDIFKLWTQAEKVDGVIDVKTPDGGEAAAETLAALTPYGTGDRYDWPTPEQARTHYDDLRETVGRLVNYAERRVPEVLEARVQRERMFRPEAG